MQFYEPLLWLLQAFALFIAFTVQGAMWKGAQDNGGRGAGLGGGIHCAAQRHPPAA